MNSGHDEGPKEIIIKQAENGFIATKMGGDSSFHEKSIVAEKDGIDDLLAKAKKWLLK